MNNLKFEWDESKNSINKRKHNISFEEAQTVFYDEMALVIDDPEHSNEEERFIILGSQSACSLSLLSFCRRGYKDYLRAKSN